MFGDHKALAPNLFELRLFFGPGYRIYHTIKGKEVVLLLTGGDKSTQGRDIAKAAALMKELEDWIMALKTKPFDVAQYLETDEDIRLFLQAAFEEGTDEEFIHALSTAARAKGMTEIARKSGLTRASLYKSLADGGKPRFDTIVKVTKALGCRLVIA